MLSYYPCTIGNHWTYRNTAGQTFSNTIVSEDNGIFQLSNTLSDTPTYVKREGSRIYTDSYEAGNFQLFLDEAATPGDHWEINFTANGVASLFTVVMRAKGQPLQVEGRLFDNVIQLEGIMRFRVGAGRINAGTKYQWYYALGIGLVLTTSSLGDNLPLQDWVVW
jgi:hypothetical protein